MVPVVRCVRASWDTSSAEGGRRIGLRRGPILSPPLSRCARERRASRLSRIVPEYPGSQLLIDGMLVGTPGGAHRSVAALKRAIQEFIEVTNEQPTPFVWTKSADDILASIARFAQRTLAAHPA